MDAENTSRVTCHDKQFVFDVAVTKDYYYIKKHAIKRVVTAKIFNYIKLLDFPPIILRTIQRTSKWHLLADIPLLMPFERRKYIAFHIIENSY